MSKTVQFLGMSAAQAGLFTGLPRQCVVDTSAWTLRVQDGITPGGFALLVANNNLTDLLNKALARDALELGTAATHAATDFDPVGAAAAVLVTAEAYTDAKLIVAKAYTDTGVATAEAFATAADTAVIASSLQKTGGIMTGDFQARDGSIWGAAGIKGLPGLGMGFNGALTSMVDVRDNANNGATLSRVMNTNAGANVSARYRVDNGTYVSDMILFGTGFTSFGLNRQNGMMLSTDGAGGLTLATFSAQPVYVGANGGFHSSFNVDGSLSVGSITNVGAGGFRAAGSIVAGVSLGVGTAATGVAGSIAAGGAITAVGNIQAFVSDMRLKEEIQPIKYASDKIRQLQGFTFELNEKGRELAPAETGRHLGVSAQLVQSLFPEAVREVGDTGFLTVMYDKLVPVLIEAFKDQDHTIRNMQMQIEALAKMVQK